MERIKKLIGERNIIDNKSKEFPEELREIPEPPNRLYCIGNINNLKTGLAIIGARKASPYGISCAKHFGEKAALLGIPVISGGAYGCDSAGQSSALQKSGICITFLGGGCDNVYPKRNFDLFQSIIDKEGVIVSENDWDVAPLKYMFLKRNRLIAGLSKATLIVEAGLPSGTFSTADEALNANREVLVIPGAISSEKSAGANRLIYSGATPIIDDETFTDQMNMLFGTLKQANGVNVQKNIKNINNTGPEDRELLCALQASPLTLDEMLPIAKKQCGKEDPISWLMMWICKARSNKWIGQYRDGSYGPIIK